MSQIKFLYISLSSHQTPKFIEKKNKDWVFYGERNNYPDYLIDLFNKSSKHNAIITGKVKFILGDGFGIDALNIQDKSLINGFIRKSGQDSLKNLTKKIATDLEVYGGYAVEVIPNKANKNIAALEHIDFGKVRVSKDDEKFAFTNDWSKTKPENNEDFTVFTPFNWMDFKDGERFIIYFKQYRPNIEHYPLPEYVASNPYIEADIEIANYHLNNIKNGFSGGYLINFNNGEPTQEEQEEIERMIKNKHTGTDNAGKFVLNFSDGKDKSAEVIPLQPNNLDKQFMQLNEQVREEIFIGHKIVSPQLFGIKTENGFSNNADELAIATEMFKHSYVEDKQGIFEDLYNSVLSFNGVNGKIELLPMKQVNKPLSEETIVSVLKEDEIREMIGREPLGRTTQTKMSSDKEELFFERVQNYGFEDEELEVVEERDVDFNPFTDEEEAKRNELKFLKFATNKQLKILDVINGNPEMELTEVAKALNIDVNELNKNLAALEDEGLVVRNNGKINVTDAGEQQVRRPELFIVYKYVKRNDVLKAKTGSRDFCRRLIRLNRNYTRADINSLTNDLGTDVWKTRGGWYNNPKTKTRTPFCRHIWRQRVVKLK